jgi:hypothetical protein
MVAGHCLSRQQATAAPQELGEIGMVAGFDLCGWQDRRHEFVIP